MLTKWLRCVGSTVIVNLFGDLIFDTLSNSVTVSAHYLIINTFSMGMFDIFYRPVLYTSNIPLTPRIVPARSILSFSQDDVRCITIRIF